MLRLAAQMFFIIIKGNSHQANFKYDLIVNRVLYRKKKFAKKLYKEDDGKLYLFGS